MSRFAAVNSVYRTFFGHNPPSRVCVELNFVNAPNEEGNRFLMVDCVSYHCPSQELREVMHVQSISHWAPANIGDALTRLAKETIGRLFETLCIFRPI